MFLIVVTLTANENAKTEWEINAEAREEVLTHGPLVVPYWLLGYPGYWTPEETQRLILEDLRLYDLLKNEKHPNALKALTACKDAQRPLERRLSIYKYTTLTLAVTTLVSLTILILKKGETNE